MDENFKRLLIEFKLKKEFFAALLAAHSKIKPLREREGKCLFPGLEFGYLFHGTGCLITYQDQEIGFEIQIENNIIRRIDGFSWFEIEQYCTLLGILDSFQSYKNILEDLIKTGEFIRSSERGNMYYTVEDFENEEPYIFDFVWVQEWFLKYGR